jgi:hypothetical protein
MTRHNKINIRPQVTMLSVLKFLEYEVWFALAEFIDNAIASYLKNEEQLKAIEGSDFKLIVKIEINDGENKITIRDNAAGISEADYARAFRAAEIPPDNTGLSEFGMGMKSAACWFADNWKVTTKALEEDFEKTVNFDMKKILTDKVDEIEVDVLESNKSYHFTVIELFNVNKMPRRRGIGKVKDHLKSIYREFIRKGVLTLQVDNETLVFADPNILNVPKYDDIKGEPVYWRKDINFPIENGLSVHGFVAIREKASTSEAGFALFRRGRVIEGSYDTGFRPEYIFGNPNSFRYQRVFGELHLEGFDVSFTKKGIQWDENLEAFLRLLKDDINNKAFPLLQQAEQYRVRATEKEYKAAKKALDETADDLKKKAPQAISDVVNAPVTEEQEQKNLTKTDKTIHREIVFRVNRTDWKVSIELSYDTSLKQLIEIANYSTDQTIRQIGIRLSLTHPFMVKFVGVDNSKIEPVLRIVAALGLSEVLAKESGIKTQGEVRRNFNELITNLSQQS